MPDPLPHPPASLIITADDFGFGVATSRGIVKAHQAGVVTAASFMVVSGDHAAASVPLLQDAPKLEIGLHLVMSGPPQKPLVAGRNSGLVGRGGAFHSLPKLLWLACRGKLNRSAAFDEICAQARRCEALLGRRPAYVDGHHHAHQLPVIGEALIDAMKQGVLPAVSRCTMEAPAVRAKVRGSGLRRAIMHRLGVTARPLFQAGGVWLNDSCFGMIGPKDLARTSLDPWAAYLPFLPSTGTIEWFVHPGEPDATLAGRDAYIDARPIELQALQALVRQHGWQDWEGVLTTKSEAAERRKNVAHG